jgi:hypothetical protein
MRFRPLLSGLCLLASGCTVAQWAVINVVNVTSVTTQKTAELVAKGATSTGKAMANGAKSLTSHKSSENSETAGAPAGPSPADVPLLSDPSNTTLPPPPLVPPLPGQ